MPSTTPSPPNTSTSSPSTLNRKYVLVGNSNHCWYGYFEDDICYWSDWCDALEDAVSAELCQDEVLETIDDFIKNNSDKLIIRLLSGPITIESHPEYFI